MVDVSLSLVGSNGDTISLEGGDFVLTTGVAGFGIPPTEVRIAESAANGGVWRNTKRGVREVDLPIVVLGTDRADVENKLRRLANVLQDTNGPTAIVASFSDGTAYQLLAHYTGGGDAAYGDDQNGYFARWVISLQAPQPFWESVTPTNYTLQLSAGRGLIRDTSLSKLRLSGQYGFGDVTLVNPGDVVAYPTWVINGPADSVSVSLNGVGFVYEDAIAADEVITIDAFAGTVRDQAGANKYASLAPAPKLFTFKPGTQTVTIAAPGATEATRISGNFKPRREVLH